METIISWTDFTWNPVTGCSKISEGCRNCYAERLSLKRGWTKEPWVAANTKENVVLHPERFAQIYKLKKPSRVFVNSMSDLFHEDVPDSFIRDIFHVMAVNDQHIFQCLTKRPERAANWEGPWPPHICMGTSVEDRKTLPRLDAIRECGAAVRFVSFEPLLEDVGHLDLEGIDWAIVGGESGPGYRPMDHAWARSIRDQCVAAGVPFFFKQSAAFRTETSTDLQEEDGTFTTWQQYPPDPRELSAEPGVSGDPEQREQIPLTLF